MEPQVESKEVVKKRAQVVVDFIYRAWIGWLVLTLAMVWILLSGPQTPCIDTKYYDQIWAVLLAGTIIVSLYTIWEMKRTQGTEEYNDLGVFKVILFCVLLALWSAACCPTIETLPMK